MAIVLSSVVCTSNQEWTMSQTIQELHLVRNTASLFKSGQNLGFYNKSLFPLCVYLCTLQGVLGGRCSGKSALVHRHLTGSYLSLENTEGWCVVFEDIVSHRCN